MAQFCIAGVPAGDANRRLFNPLLAWSLSMTIVGAALCWLLFARRLRRPRAKL